MRYKKIMILAILLVSLLAVSAVSAAENATDDIVGIEETTDEVVSVEENQTIDDNAFDLVGSEDTLILSLSDDEYVGSSDNLLREFDIDDDWEIRADNVTKYYGSDKQFYAWISHNGYYKSGYTIEFHINDEVIESKGRTYLDSNYYFQTMKPSIDLNYPAGTYQVICKCENLETSAIVTILPTILGNDVTGTYKNTKYSVVVLDSNGNRAGNANVDFEINSETSTRTTNSNGVATLDVNLLPGTYYVTVKNPITSEEITNKIVIENGGSNLNLDVPDVTKDYGGSEKLEITLTDSGSPIANANVNININGQTYTKTTDSKGKAYLELDLKANNYDATVTYKDISTTAKVIINKLTTKNTLSYTKNSQNSFTLTASVNPSSASGNVVFTVNGEVYTAKVNGGKATYTLNNLAAGSYDVNSNYNGDANHKASASNSIKFTVNADDKLDTKLTAQDVATTYNGGENLVATLKADNTVNGIRIIESISGANVIVNLNNVDYTLKTDSQGEVSLSTDGLAPGTYIATITYEGNSKYSPSSAIVNVVVNKADSSISAANNNAASEIVATLTNANTGKAISGANVKFNINGVKTTVKTNSKGQAKISTQDVPTGSTVTISYAGNSKYKSTSTKVVVSDKTDLLISADYDVSNNQIVATLTNAATGKAVANANVKVIMNGATVTAKTNNKGQAMVSAAALPLGTNTAKITYAGNSKYNPASTTISFDVKTKVIITDIYGDSSELRAKLTNGATGSPIANANMDIMVFYYSDDYDHWLSCTKKTAKSDSKGQISLPHMLLGEEYSNEVIISYAGNSRYTPSNATAMIDINKANMMITYSYNANKQKLTATLKNSQTGKAVSNANMVVDVNGVLTTLKSNSNGQITFSTAGFAPGTYVGTISYGGNAKYNQISAAFKADI